jgi:RNA polymerase sigma-70 factor, ECF subfamily
MPQGRNSSGNANKVDTCSQRMIRELPMLLSSQGFGVMSLEPTIQDEMLAAVPRLRALAISLCRNRDQADDLVQDTMLRACAGIRSFKPGTNMCAWLCTIQRNHFYSEWRRRMRRPESAYDHAETVALKPTQIAQIEHGEVCRALAKLLPRQREALLLVAVSGLSYAEVARQCQCPVGTIKSRISRARAALAKLLAIECHGDFGHDPVMSAIAGGSEDRLRA